MSLEQLYRNAYCDHIRSLIGAVPYIWGGQDRTVGLDCSGVVIDSLRVAGFSNIEDMTSQGLHDRFHENIPNEIKPGCLFFYGSNHRHISHVMSVTSVWSKGEVILAGAIHGTSKTLTPSDAYAQKAWVQTVRGDYWKSKFVSAYDPFKEFEKCSKR